MRNSHKDITARKKIGGKMARLASFPEDNPNPVIEIDAGNSITYLNSAARAHYPDLLALGPRHPILEGVTAAVATVHNEGKGALSREVAVGDKVYEEQIHAVPGKNFIQIYLRDITERKRVEEALRRLEKAVETMQLGVTITDTDGRIVYTNPAEASMHGYTVEELIDKHMKILAPRTLWKSMTWEQMKKMKSWRRESINIRKDGSRFPVELMSDVVTNVAGDPIGIVTSCEDISKRKRAEQALQAAKDYAENIISSSLDMIISVDANRNIIEFNRAAEQALGYSKAEVLGKPVDLLYADPSEGLWVNTNLLKHGAFTGEITSKKKNGETFYSYLSASVMRNRHGRILGVMGISRDTTERKRTEEQLRRTNAELLKSDNTLRKALSDLQKSHEEFKSCELQLIHAEKLESVGRLAAGVAHEVKNPLMTILLGVDYLSKHVPTKNDNVPVVLKDMTDAVRRADAIIRGLVDFSAPKQLNLKDEALNAIVKEALRLVKNALLSSHITTVKNLKQDLPPLRLDRQKIGQVFVNLFMNAIHAMPEGGRLTVKTYAKQLTEIDHNVRYRETDRFRIGETVVVAEVEDTGTGIPEDKLGKLFDPFFTTKPTGQGTGLGLAVTNSIIELHGGMIDIRNRNEGGVKVVMMFSTKKEEA